METLGQNVLEYAGRLLLCSILTAHSSAKGPVT